MATELLNGENRRVNKDGFAKNVIRFLDLIVRENQSPDKSSGLKNGLLEKEI